MFVFSISIRVSIKMINPKSRPLCDISKSHSNSTSEPPLPDYICNYYVYI